MSNQAILKNNPQMPYLIEEALNRLRINVSFLGSKIRKIVIISSEPNEGKSFIAMHLWQQMAIAGEKSILVDVDMRKSIMLQKYGIVREDGKDILGLTHYLAEDKPLEDCILKTQWEAGDLLPNSNNVVNPSMLLESQRFSDLLDQLAKEYRYVFLDSPPLGLVSDGERIGHMCDGAILVVRSGVTPKAVVRNSVAQLERAGCPLLGITLNRVNSSGGKYYHNYYGRYYYGGKGYGYGYGYYGKSKSDGKGKAK